MVDTDNIIVAQKHLEGKTQDQIALEMGCSQPTITRRLNLPDTKAYIEKIQSEFLDETLQKAKDNIAGVIADYKSCDPKSYQDKEHGFKASMRVLESVGILSGHTQSYYFMSIFASQTNIISPVIQQVLSSISGSSQDQPIDAEFYAST